MITKKTILVTGGTGALGGAVVPALLTRYPDYGLLLLTRNASRYLQTSRIRYVQCDLLSDPIALSLTSEDFSSIDKVLHLAADVSWNAEVEHAVEINTRATERLLALIRNRCANISVFLNCSTAYVEAPIPKGNNRFQIAANRRVFNNAYEYSKWLAEQAVKSSGLPWIIVRPSLILGDTHTGKIDSFNGFYYMMRTITKGHLPFLVGEEKATVDIVPLDVACLAIMNSLNNSQHLEKVIWAISADQKPTIGQLVGMSISTINEFRQRADVDAIKQPSIIDSERYHRLFKPLMEGELSATQKRFVDFMDVFVPYFSMQTSLKPSSDDIVYQAEPFEVYLRKSMEYWCKAHSRFVLGKLYQWKFKTAGA